MAGATQVEVERLPLRALLGASGLALLSSSPTMPVRDQDHDRVRHALLADGWTITHDPLRLRWGGRDMYVDLGVQRLLAAEKAERRIAVEIKMFAGPSLVDDLEKAIGQYALYKDIMEDVEPGRDLYVAVREVVYADFFQEPIGRLALDKGRLKLIVYDPTTEIIRRWIPSTATSSSAP
jgi:hypothetical protein